MTRFSHLGLATVLVASLSGVAAATPIYTGPTQAERDAGTLRKYDRNHNGVIDPVERRRMLIEQRQSTLEHFDMNDNGRLNPAEVAMARRYRIDKLVAMLDSNRDGVLSFAEARVHGRDSQLVEHFRSIDSNHNGRLSKVELIASPYVQTPAPIVRPWWSWWGRKAPA
jgi:Ca2+-binding EF-hand superfamily protein